MNQTRSAMNRQMLNQDGAVSPGAASIGGESQALFTLQQAQDWLTGAHLLGQENTAVRRVHTDTRSLQEGDLFVALKGERFDGNQFLSQARADGAAAAICSDEAALRESGLPGLVVSDTRQALGELAAAWRSQFKLPLVAVTGSNGKTTVTQMIAAIMRCWKPQAVLATEGNLNNEIGLPLTLLGLRAIHQIAVVELGMNHPGEISWLAGVAQPTVALVNNAQREHQEFMTSIQAVAQENGAVIKALGPSGTAVFPADDAFTDLWSDLAGERPRLTFGMATHTPGLEPAHRAEANIIGVGFTWSGDGWQVNAITPGGPLEFTLQVAGIHNVRNALAAAACAIAAGVPLAAIRQGLGSFEPVKGRSRAQRLRVSGHAVTLVDDSYNANPDSVRAAIDVLAGLPGPRLLVLGDMGEVGSQGPLFHAEVGEYARQRGIEQLFAMGQQTQASLKAYGAGSHFADIDTLNAAVLEMLPGLGSVLVKGSRFMKMERVVQALSKQAEFNRGEAHAA